MADKITTLKLSDNTKVYPNTKDQNIPDTIARVNDLNHIKEDINSLKTQVSSIDTKTQNITGYLATINDIPTYYQHMVTIRGGLTDNRTVVTFNAIARTKTDINSLLTLSDVLGGRWFAVSGVTPDSDNSKTTPISIFIDKQIRDSHIVFVTLHGNGNLDLTTMSNQEITDKISAI